MFTVVKDILSFLDAILSDNELKVESRNFEDIHKQYDTSKFDIEALKNEIVIKSEDFLSAIKPIPDENEKCEPIIFGEFYQFDEQTTANLIQNCRKHNATVQGVISTASLISLLLVEKQDIKENEIIKCINSVPCNMRSLIHPKLSNEDIVCGSAALTWPQDIKGSDDLWELAANATKSIHELRNSDHGYKWWIKIANSCPIQQYSIMSSSIGLVELNEHLLKNISLNDIRMIGGTYGLAKDSAGNMTHAFTSLNKLTVVMSYTYPPLNKAWAKTFASRQSNILKYFAKPEEIKHTLKTIVEELL